MDLLTAVDMFLMNRVMIATNVYDAFSWWWGWPEISDQQWQAWLG